MGTCKKSVLVVDTQECCEQCRLKSLKAIHGEGHCSIMNRYFEDYQTDVPDWCPLVMLIKKSPSKLPPMADMDLQYTQYEKGWNDCLKQILSKE